MTAVFISWYLIFAPHQVWIRVMTFKGCFSGPSCRLFFPFQLSPLSVNLAIMWYSFSVDSIEPRDSLPRDPLSHDPPSLSWEALKQEALICNRFGMVGYTWHLQHLVWTADDICSSKSKCTSMKHKEANDVWFMLPQATEGTCGIFFLLITAS